MIGRKFLAAMDRLITEIPCEHVARFDRLMRAKEIEIVLHPQRRIPRESVPVREPLEHGEFDVGRAQGCRDVPKRLYYSRDPLLISGQIRCTTRQLEQQCKLIAIEILGGADPLVCSRPPGRLFREAQRVKQRRHVSRKRSISRPERLQVTRLSSARHALSK